MPRHRLPRELWQVVRQKVWLRDDRRCVRCGTRLKLCQCHIDHVQSGKLAGNGMGNLRTLCRRCHVLRADLRHRGMIGAALRDGIIPPDWRDLIWYG